MKPRLDGFRALAKHVLETAKRLEAQQSLVDQGVAIKRPQALQVPLGKIPKVSDFVRYRLEHRTLDQTGQTRLYAILEDDVDAAAYALYQTTNTTTNTPTTTKEPTE